MATVVVTGNCATGKRERLGTVLRRRPSDHSMVSSGSQSSLDTCLGLGDNLVR